MLPTVKRQNNWLPSIFNDFFNDEWFPMRATTAPAINVKEFDKEFLIEIAVPGMTKEDFKIHVNAKNQLVVSVEKNKRVRTMKRLLSSSVENLITLALSKHCYCQKMLIVRRLLQKQNMVS